MTSMGIDVTRSRVAEDADLVCPALCSRHQRLYLESRDVESDGIIELDLVLKCTVDQYFRI